MSDPLYREGRHLAALLFIDMVGYSRHMQVDEGRTIAQVDELFRVVRTRCGEAGGREIDTAGDGILLEFSGALRALQCALAVLEDLADRNRNRSADLDRIQARASVHIGELEHREGRLFGDGVNIGARLLPLAPPGAVAFSSHVKDQVDNVLDRPILRLGRKALKNIREPVDVFCVAGSECRQQDINECTGDDLPPEAVRTWTIGDLVVAERSMTISLAGEPVTLERKPFEVLLFLLRHAGEVVTKDELLEAVWPGRILSDTALNKAISRIRTVIGDEEQSVIVTQRGYGYRFAAPVRVDVEQAGAATVLSLKPGHRLDARPNWQLVQQLGLGGHGEVWLARHDKTREERVFKLALEAGHLNALKREITLSRLLHEAYPASEKFVRVLDWNLDKEPFFIESEYSREGSLIDWARESSGLQAVALGTRLEIAAQIAEALGLAHDLGILHKDLKPGNVLVHHHPVRGISIRLADFGSGAMLDAGKADEFSITRLGLTSDADLAADSTTGTPLYLAPEVLAGQPASARGDVYALGVMLYQLVVGDFKRTLAPGWEHNIADAVLREDIAIAAHGDPARRLANASELAQRLRSLEARHQEMQRQVEQQASAQRAEALRRQNRRMRGFVAVTAAFLAVSLSLGGLAWHSRQQAIVARDRAELIARFIADDMLINMNVDVRDMRSLTMSDWLGHVAEQIPSQLNDEPEVAVRLYLALAHAYAGIGQGARAIEVGRRAVGLARAGWPADPGPALSLAEHAGGHLAGLVRLDELSFWQAVQVQAKNSWGDADRRLILFELHMLQPLGRFVNDFDGEARGRALLSMARLRFPEDRDVLMTATKVFSDQLVTTPNTADEIQALLDEHYGLMTPEERNHLSTIVQRSQAYATLEFYGRKDPLAAQQLLVDAIRELRTRAHEDSPFLADVEFHLLILRASLTFSGDYPLQDFIAELEAHDQKAQRIFAGEDENLTVTSRFLAWAYLLGGEPQKADFYARRLLDIAERHREPGSYGIDWARFLVASCDRALGRVEQARQGFDQLERSNNWGRLEKDGRVQREHALLLAAEGQTEAAVALLKTTLEQMQAELGGEHLLARLTRADHERLKGANR